jgi:hypothetical protein
MRFIPPKYSAPVFAMWERMGRKKAKKKKPLDR